MEITEHGRSTRSAARHRPRPPCARPRGAGGPGAQVGFGLGGREDLRLRPHGRPRTGLLDRHPAPHGVRLTAHRPRLLLHAHRCRRPLPAHEGQGRVLPDGVGRQRAAHREARAELLRGPRGRDAALRPRFRAAARGRRGQVHQGPRPEAHLAPQLRGAVRAPHRRGRGPVRGPVALPGAQRGLEAELPDDRAARPQGRPGGVLAQPGARRGVPGGGAGPVGRDLPDGGRPGRVGVPRVPGLLPPHRLPPHGRLGRRRGRPGGRPRGGRRRRVRGDDPPGAVGRVRGADRPPGRRALQAALRQDGGLPRLRRRGAHPGPPGRREGQGRGHRHVLHLRRHHGHRLVARPGPAAARDPAQGRAHRRRHARVDHHGGRPDGLRGDLGQDDVLGPRGRGGAPARVG